jgi:succinate dehydrogenase / fumarate reductase, cytochrome b subunit
MRVLHAFSTSVGSKILLALTGLALFGFLVIHLAGNLLIFAGADRFNGYSAALINNPLIIPAELGLLLLFVIHVYKAIRGLVRNRAARPVAYKKTVWAGGPSRKSWGSASMALTGTTILLFVVIHLKTFKFGPHYQAAGEATRDLHRLVVEVFRNPFYVVFYVLAMALIGLHLRHGVSSAVQSLGLMPSGATRAVLAAGAALAAVIALGFAVIPVVVFFTR